MLGILEQQLMVHAGDGADDRAVVVADGDQIRHRLVGDVVVPDHVDAGGHHPAPHVNAIHLLGVSRRLQFADGESGRIDVDLLVGKAQSVGVTGIDEQLVR